MYRKVLYIFPVCSGFPSRLFCTSCTAAFACSGVVSFHLIFSTSSGFNRSLSSSAIRLRISSGLKVCGRVMGVERVAAGSPIAVELVMGVAGPAPVALAVAKLANVRPGEGELEAGGVFVVGTCVLLGVTAVAGDVFLL